MKGGNNEAQKMIKPLSPHCTLADCDDCGDAREYLGDTDETIKALTADGWLFGDKHQCHECAEAWGADDNNQSMLNERRDVLNASNYN